MNTNKTNAKRHYQIIILVMLVFFVISFITNILNSIIVDVKTSFDLSLTMTGLLPFSFFIAYGVMSIPAGFLSEKYSDKTLLSVSFIVMTLASIGFAIAPSYYSFTITLFSVFITFKTSDTSPLSFPHVTFTLSHFLIFIISYQKIIYKTSGAKLTILL